MNVINHLCKIKHLRQVTRRPPQRSQLPSVILNKSKKYYRHELAVRLKNISILSTWYIIESKSFNDFRVRRLRRDVSDGVF